MDHWTDEGNNTTAARMFERYSEDLRRGLLWARAYTLAAEASGVGWEQLLAGVVEVTPNLGLPSETILSRLQLRRPTKEPGQITNWVTFGCAPNTYSWLY